MAEKKNTNFNRPGGYATPKGATQIQKKAARELAQADIRLYGDMVPSHYAKHKPRHSNSHKPGHSEGRPKAGRATRGGCSVEIFPLMGTQSGQEVGLAYTKLTL